MDPGTYDYFTYPEWRQYFRSTRAHNTVEIDGADQSVMLGSFLWNRHARAKSLQWRPNQNGGVVTGEHDGYKRLPDPVIHRRGIALDGVQRKLTVSDEIRAADKHQVVIYFHVAPECTVAQLDENRIVISAAHGQVTMEFDPALKLETVFGSDSPKAGWVSRGYHQKQATTTIVARAETFGSAVFNTRIAVGR